MNYHTSAFDSIEFTVRSGMTSLSSAGGTSFKFPTSAPFMAKPCDPIPNPATPPAAAPAAGTAPAAAAFMLILFHSFSTRKKTHWQRRTISSDVTMSTVARLLRRWAESLYVQETRSTRLEAMAQ